MATTIPTNQASFTLAEVLTATGGAIIKSSRRASRQGGAETELCGVSTDTRTVTAGAIFVALRGERYDGHAFVASAAQAGAALVIVEQEQESDLPQVLVSDTLVALGELAAFHRRRWGGSIVAIAGAAGKTTTRSFLSALLEQVYGAAVHSTAGNLNNRIGVPMVLLGLRESHRFAVVEVGTNQPGEVRALARLAAPDVAVLTLIALEHCAGLGGLDDVEREEAEIFADTCREFVVNGDDERALRQARTRAEVKGTRVRSYGFGGAVDLRGLERATLTPHQSRLRLTRRPAGVPPDTAKLSATDIELLLPIVGQPAAYALMAAWLAAEALCEHPITVKQVQRALHNPALQPEGRTQVVPLPDGALIINDAYNANPPSMQAALLTAQEVCQLRGGRLHLVLGEMRELGALSGSAHAELGVQLRDMPWSTLCLIGDETAAIRNALLGLSDPERVVLQSQDTQGVASVLRSRLGPCDVVLVKGSRGIRAEQVIADLISQKATSE